MVFLSKPFSEQQSKEPYLHYLISHSSQQGVSPVWGTFEQGFPPTFQQGFLIVRVTHTLGLAKVGENRYLNKLAKARKTRKLPGTLSLKKVWAG